MSVSTFLGYERSFTELLRLYRIVDKYIRFLKSRDAKIHKRQVESAYDTSGLLF